MSSRTADGLACVDDLVLAVHGIGDYKVTETVPAGYAAAGDLTRP